MHTSLLRAPFYKPNALIQPHQLAEQANNLLWNWSQWGLLHGKYHGKTHTVPEMTPEPLCSVVHLIDTDTSDQLILLLFLCNNNYNYNHNIAVLGAPRTRTPLC